jgi:hypothetical protein
MVCLCHTYDNDISGGALYTITFIRSSFDCNIMVLAFYIIYGFVFLIQLNEVDRWKYVPPSTQNIYKQKWVKKNLCVWFKIWTKYIHFGDQFLFIFWDRESSTR